MDKRPTSRRERAAAREAVARRRRWMGWIGAGLVVAVAVIVAVVVLLGGDDDDGPSVLTPDDQLANGEELFQANCATCHGDDLTGTFVGPPLLHEIYAPGVLADDAIRAAVANGVTPRNWDFSGMPPFPNLDSEDVEALIVFVRTSQRAAGLGGLDSAAPSSTAE